MRIVIVGPGALGTVFAAALDRGGHDVTLLGAPPAPGSTPRQSGRQLRSLNGELTRLPVPVSDDPSLVAGADVVLVLVKAGDTAAALERIAPYLPDDAIVVTLQNGLGAADRIRAIIGEDRHVLPGVTSQAATRSGPAMVTHTGEGPTLIGFQRAADAPAARRIARVFTAAGLPSAAVADIDRESWRKAAINAAINGLTALGGFENGAIVDAPDLLEAAETIAEEAAAVARAHGIELGGMRKAVVETATATARNRSSMLQDLETGRVTEVDAIHGQIQAAARSAGIATPAMDVVAALIRAKSRQTRAKELSVV